MPNGLMREGQGARGGRSVTFVRACAIYLLMVVVPVGVAVYLLRTSAGLSAAPEVAAVTPAPLADAMGQVLLASAVIVGLAGLLGLACRALGQSPVVGEMVAGILLGPSAFGLIAPDVAQRVFPAETISLLNVLAQVGVVFFMFQIGRELPLTMLRRVGWATLPVGHAAIAVPFVLGVGLALGLREQHQPAGVRGLPFVLFVALAVSVTAFPVLARILADRNLIGSRLGTMGLAVAGVGDVTAWCALGLVIAEVHKTSSLGVLFTIVEVILFTALLWYGVRPSLAFVFRIVERRWTGGLPVGALIASFILLCAVLTNWMGVHPIFGAFLAGIVMPRSSRSVADFAAKTEGLTAWVLLPLFFATIGLQTRLQDVFSGDAMGPLAAVLLVAIVGKFVGAGVAARMSGENWNSALGLGVMMNCRGLTELVVLNIGLSLGVIGLELFSMLVVMTLVTTMATDPLLRLLKIGRLSPNPPVENVYQLASAPKIRARLPLGNPADAPGAPIQFSKGPQ